MNLSIVAAIDLNAGLGNKGDLPWPRLSGDLRRFKWLTEGSSVVMGRKTFESIGKPLPKRQNIVLSGSRHFPGTIQAKNFYSALVKAKGASQNGDVFVIGGASLYELAMAHESLQNMHLSVVHGTFEADVFFPAWSPNDWKEVLRVTQLPNEKNPYMHTYVHFVRKAV